MSDTTEPLEEVIRRVVREELASVGPSACVCADKGSRACPMHGMVGGKPRCFYCPSPSGLGTSCVLPFDHEGRHKIMDRDPGGEQIAVYV